MNWAPHKNNKSSSVGKQNSLSQKTSNIPPKSSHVTAKQKHQIQGAQQNGKLQGGATKNTGVKSSNQWEDKETTETTATTKTTDKLIGKGINNHKKG